MGLFAGARLAVVDTETTGFDPVRDALVEVACVVLDDGRIGESWSTLTDPGRPIPEEARRVHNISDAMVRGAPGPPAVAADLAARCADRTLVFHNAGFDLPFLAALLRKAGRPPLLNPVVDTVGLARGLFDVGGNALGSLAKRLGLPEETSHRALGDALTTARLLLVLAERWEREKGVRTLAELAAASQDVVRLTNRRPRG